MAKARSKAVGCAERMFLVALRRENGQRKPLKSVENVVRGVVLQVLGSMDSVEEACRKAGVCVESHDRMQLFLNAFIRSMAVESSSQLLPSALRSGRECSVETRDRRNRVCFGCSIVGQMNPSARLRGSGKRRGEARIAVSPGRGHTGTAPRGEVSRRNVEDSHSALQEMQARLAAETDERDHHSRAGDESDKRIVLQKLLGESPATVGPALSSCADARWRPRRQFSYLTIKDFAARISKAMIAH